MNDPCICCKRKPNCPANCYPRKDYEKALKKRGNMSNKSKPITKAEMNRRADKAFRSAVAIMLLCVAESGRYTNDELGELWDSCNARADSIAKHYCTLEDIRKTLLDEYGITVGGSLA